MNLPRTALPARWYTEPAIREAEELRIFGSSWQLIGHTSLFTGEGARRVDVIGNLPVVLVRDEHGQIRGFHNVCRHRAGPVATESGTAGSLVCAYHGWTYGLDGRLKRAPDMPACDGFEPAQVRLPGLEIAVWQGLVFAADRPSHPFDGLVEGIAERIDKHNPADWRHHRRCEYSAGCNWKVYVDNFLEGYHLPRVHPGLNRLLDYRSYRTELSARHSLQWSPLESRDNPYGPGEALYYFLWPNTMLNFLPGRLQTNRVLPEGPNRCRVIFDYYYPDAFETDRATADEQLSDEIQREDLAICEAVQRGLGSGSWESGPLNPDHESGVAHFQDLYRRAME